MSGSVINRWFGKGWLTLGFVFLYLPIVALVLYSFNDSPVPNAWRGFTLKWYYALVPLAIFNKYQAEATEARK